MKKRLILVLAIFFPVQIVLVKLLALVPNLVEQFYSLGIYKLLSGIQKILTFWIPFSLGQWLFYAAVFWLLYHCYKGFIRLKNSKTERPAILKEFAVKSFAILSIIYFIFNILWGINYSRNSLETTLNLSKLEPDNNRIKALALYLIEQTNASRKKLDPIGDTTLVLDWKNKQYFAEANLAFELLAQTNSVFSNSKPSVKAVAIPQLMSIFGIGGIYFPFTGEANVNMHQPDFKLPFTVCHEMAHQIGFASESEANFIAFLACRQSESPVFNYSGNFVAMRYALNALHLADTAAFNELIVKLDKGILLDLEANTLYWERFETIFDDVSSFVNDLFLKANGQSEGINSYGLVIDLMLADFEKSKAAQKPVYKPSLKPVETKPEIIPDPAFVAFCESITQINLPFGFSCQALQALEMENLESNPFGELNFTLHGRLFLDEQKVLLLISANEENAVPKLVEYTLDGNLQSEMYLYDIAWCIGENSSFSGQILPNLQIELNLQKINCQTVDELNICDTINSTEQKTFVFKTQ